VVLVLGGCQRGLKRDEEKDQSSARVREATIEAKGSLEALGYTVRSFRFEGGLVDAWIEVEDEGQKPQRLAGGFTEDLTGLLRTGGHSMAPGAVRGSITWLQSEVNGKVLWGLAVAVEDAKGKSVASSARRDFDPFLPQSQTVSYLPLGTPETGWLSLKSKEETTLYTQRHSIEGKPTRIYRLKCKPGDPQPE
jgi:hypothetical protein